MQKTTRSTVDRYVQAGWTVIATPGTINDFIAKRNIRLHFVQVVCADDDPRCIGEATNVFVQNAFSNNATPVRARVRTVVKKVAGEKTTQTVVSYEDANTSARIVVARKPATDASKLNAVS